MFLMILLLFSPAGWNGEVQRHVDLGVSTLITSNSWLFFCGLTGIRTVIRTYVRTRLCAFALRIILLRRVNKYRVLGSAHFPR